MKTLHINFTKQLLSALRIACKNASKGDRGRRLVNVHLTTGDGTVIVTSTNLYSVSRFTVNVPDAVAGREWYVEAEHLTRAIRGIRARDIEKTRLLLSETVTVRHIDGDRTLADTSHYGELPPLDRFFDETRHPLEALTLSNFTIPAVFETLKAFPAARISGRDNNAVAVDWRGEGLTVEVVAIQADADHSALPPITGSSVNADETAAELEKTRAELEKTRAELENVRGELGNATPTRDIDALKARALAISTITEKMADRFITRIALGDAPETAAKYAVGGGNSKRVDALAAVAK